MATGGLWTWLASAHGFSATAQPTWIEARLAALSRKLALPSGQGQLHNPFPATPTQLSAARGLFAKQCSLCHASNGAGDTAIGQSLYPKVPDLRGLTQGKSDGALFYSIRNGIRLSGMPAWRQDNDLQIWGLVSLIRSMKERATPQ
ncbi:MAG: c-type cytochrome [Terriglobales bacterium]